MESMLFVAIPRQIGLHLCFHCSRSVMISTVLCKRGRGCKVPLCALAWSAAASAASVVLEETKSTPILASDPGTVLVW